MKQVIPNFFKLIALVAVSAGIFFLVSMDEETQDDALASSMNFLGAKLLAMAPHDDGKQVEEQFKLLEKETMEGKVDPYELQNFAVTVLNLEAEGKKLETEKIASLIAEARKNKSTSFDQERMHRLAAQLHQYEEFEQRLKKIAPLTPRLVDSVASVPRYRISPQFTIQIDTMHFAFTNTPEVPETPAVETPVVKVFTKDSGFPEKAKALAELSKELRDLKIEFGRIQMDMEMNDSLRIEMADSLQIVQKRIQQKVMQKIEALHDAPPQNIP